MFAESVELILSMQSFIEIFRSAIVALISVEFKPAFSFAFLSCSSKSPVRLSTLEPKVSVVILRASLTDDNCEFIALVTSSSFSFMVIEFVFSSSVRTLIPF